MMKHASLFHHISDDEFYIPYNACRVKSTQYCRLLPYTCTARQANRGIRRLGAQPLRGLRSQRLHSNVSRVEFEDCGETIDIRTDLNHLGLSRLVPGPSQSDPLAVGT